MPAESCRARSIPLRWFRARYRCGATRARFPLTVRSAGYFSPILADQKVRGPIVTTQSTHDQAVGMLYPLASRITGSANFAQTFSRVRRYRRRSGLLQGIPSTVRARELKMLRASGIQYAFAPGKIYNVDGSVFIAHMDGVSGAHSDIAGPEVAHLIWAAAFASAASAGV